MKLTHIELKDANAFVSKHHRHHKPVVGHRFSIGCVNDGILIGVAIVGRPVARGSDDGMTVEVTRLCSAGHANVCSFLYGAAARAAKALGYSKIQTYILQTESGTSLKASGWIMETLTAGGTWKHTHGDRNNDFPTGKKQRWAKLL